MPNAQRVEKRAAKTLAGSFLGYLHQLEVSASGKGRLKDTDVFRSNARTNAMTGVDEMTTTSTEKPAAGQLLTPTNRQEYQQPVRTTPPAELAPPPSWTLLDELLYRTRGFAGLLSLYYEYVQLLRPSLHSAVFTHAATRLWQLHRRSSLGQRTIRGLGADGSRRSFIGSRHVEGFKQGEAKEYKRELKGKEWKSNPQQIQNRTAESPLLPSHLSKGRRQSLYCYH